MNLESLIIIKDMPTKVWLSSYKAQIDLTLMGINLGFSIVSGYMAKRAFQRKAKKEGAIYFIIGTATLITGLNLLKKYFI